MSQTKSPNADVNLVKIFKFKLGPCYSAVSCKKRFFANDITMFYASINENDDLFLKNKITPTPNANARAKRSKNTDTTSTSSHLPRTPLDFGSSGGARATDDPRNEHRSVARKLHRVAGSAGHGDRWRAPGQRPMAAGTSTRFSIGARSERRTLGRSGGGGRWRPRARGGEGSGSCTPARSSPPSTPSCSATVSSRRAPRASKLPVKNGTFFFLAINLFSPSPWNCSVIRSLGQR